MFLILAFFSSALAYSSFLQMDIESYVPVFSSAETYDSMEGDLSTDPNSSLQVLTQLQPKENAKPLTWADIEDTDNKSELETLAADSSNPVAQVIT
jgi:hypothetical protein